MKSFIRGPMPFLCIGHSFDHMLILLFATVVVVGPLKTDFGMTYGELVGLAWLGFILFGAGAPLAGWLADRWSSVGTMTVFFLGIGASSVLAGLASSPWEIAVALSAIGLFASIYHPVGIPMVIRAAGEHRGKMLGINGIFGSLGMASAAIVAELLTLSVSWRAAFIVPGMAAIVAGVWFYMRCRGMNLDVSRAKANENASLKDFVAEFGLRPFLRVMGLLALLTFCMGMVFQAMTFSLTNVVELRVDIALGALLGAGALTSVILAVAGGAQLLGGVLADRYPLKRLFLLTYGLMAPALLLATTAADEVMVFSLFMVMVCTVGTQPISDALFGKYVPQRWINTAYGLRFAISLCSSAAALPLVAFVFDSTGDFYYLFLVLSVFAAVAITAIALLPTPADERGEPVPVAAE
ncbi:MAG TPA: MFS transporter [Alphaproteobacteria bacterium]|nr:MFS transporter [Alphaproteobacteria bacterium]